MRSAMQANGFQVGRLFFLLAGFLLTPSQGQAADNLIFKGNLVAEACTLRPGDEALAVEMGEVSSRDLYTNTRTVGRLFEIHLEDCDSSTADSVTTTFSGVENIELPGLLALDGGSVAKGIAIGLETPADQPLPLNVVSDEQALSEGHNVIAFKAYIRGEPQALADQSLSAGVFSAISTFTLDYP